MKCRQAETTRGCFEKLCKARFHYVQLHDDDGTAGPVVYGVGTWAGRAGLVQRQVLYAACSALEAVATGGKVNTGDHLIARPRLVPTHPFLHARRLG